MKIRLLFLSFISIIFFLNLSVSQTSISPGLLEYANGNYANALKIFLADTGNLDKNSRQIAMCYYNLNVFSEAERYFLFCVKKDSTDYSSYYYLGKTSKITGKSRNAASYFAKAIEKKPDYFNALFELSTLNYELKNFDAAIKLFKKCVEVDSFDCLSNHYCGMSLFQMGSFDSALTYFKKAVSITPEFLPAINSIGGCYYLKKEYDSSILMYNKSITIDSSAGSIYKRLADSYYRAENNREAINNYLMALNHGEKNSSIPSLLAWLYKKESVYDSSIIYFKLYLGEDLNDPQRWLDLAKVHLLMRNTDSAKYCYEKTIALHESDVSGNIFQIYLQYSEYLRSLKDIKGSADKLLRALDLNKKFPFLYYQLGDLYAELKNYKEAVKSFEKHLEYLDENEKNAKWRTIVEDKIKLLKKKI